MGATSSTRQTPLLLYMINTPRSYMLYPPFETVFCIVWGSMGVFSRYFPTL